MGKKIGTSILGIPVWAIIAIAIFLIVNILYDLWVGDRNFRRYSLLAGSFLIIIIAIFINLTSKRTVRKIAVNQMGG